MKLHFLASFTDADPTADGWPIIFIDEGEVTGRGWGIWEQGLQASLPKFENVWVQAFRFEGGGFNHLSDDVRAIFPSGVITDNIIGIAGLPKLETLSSGKKAITGVFRPATDKMQTLLKMAKQAGKLHEFGLSINGDVTQDVHLTNRTLTGGRTIAEVLEIDELYSTDMVTNPGRGGGFRDMLASAGLIHVSPTLQQSGGISMRKLLKEYLEKRGITFQDGSALSILASIDPDRITEAEQTLFAQIKMLLEASQNDAAEAAMHAVLTAAPSKDDDEDNKGGESEEDEEENDEDEEDKQAVQASNPTLDDQMRENQILNTKMRIKFALDEEKRLKESTKTLIASKLDGQILTDKQIQAEIKLHKAVLASEYPDAGKPNSLQASGSMLSVGLNPGGKIQQACDRLFGVNPTRLKQAVQTLEASGITPQEKMMEVYGLRASAEIPDRYEYPFMSLKKLYLMCYPGDPEISFNPRKMRAVASAVVETTFADAVSTSMNRRLLQDWIMKELPWRRIASIKPGGFSDFREQQIIRVGGFGELATVADDGAYQEISLPTDEKETYTPLTKGNLLPITRRTVLRDDVGLVNRLIVKLRRSAQYTFNKAFFKQVINWDTAINDGTMSDGKAVYHADHNNLATTAFSHAGILELNGLINAQTEQDSSIPLELEGKYLIIASDHRDNGRIYIRSERLPGDVVNDANVVTVDEENLVIVNKIYLGNSATYYYMFTDPMDYPTIEVAFLFDQQVPELFTQDEPTVGDTFKQDRFTWKIRYEYGIGLGDWRGCARNGA